MLLKDFIREGCKALASVYSEREARSMVLRLFEERLGVKSYTHLIEPDTEIPESALPGLQNDLLRLSVAEPLQYVLGYADFCGRRFKVSPAVLIPRPETEQLAEMAVKAATTAGAGARVLDLCTGSGCIAWTVKKEVPGVEVVAVDISREALDVARRQFDGPAPDFVRYDVLDKEAPHGFDVGFDVIVSNPPYIMEGEKRLMCRNVLDYEPSLALFVPDDDPLVFYRALAVWAVSCLKKGGVGFVEINEQLGDQTADIFRGAGFSQVSLITDFCNKIRFISFCK